MIRTPGNRAFLALCLSILTLPAHADSAGDSPLTVTSLWESKYVSEGRNNIDHGGLFSTAGGKALGNGVSVGAWLATGDSDDYGELQAFIEYGVEAGPFEAQVGYKRLAFLDNGKSDNEISAGLTFDNAARIIPALNYTHSTEADGGFLELSLRSEVTPFGEGLTLEPYVLEGFDFGYATKGHDGPNNFQVGMGFSTPLADQVEIIGSINHSWAQTDLKNEGLGDVFWATLGFRTAF